ncbi:MAG TPA: hypothetical protein VLB44_08260 [Kofleriaceae bacterium]|nr:hypothetical protein [Kofleriaceae bacterium]
MKQLALSLVVLSGCSLYFDDPGDPPPDPQPEQPTSPTPPTSNFVLTQTKAIAGELPVVGIDSDRAGGVWVAYRKPTTSYYENADVHVVHLDADGTKLTDWLYQDEYTLVAGIAYDGTALWLNYNSNTSADNNHVRKIDATTGDTLTGFATEAGIVDVSIRADTLLLSRAWNEIVTLDDSSGGELARTPIDAFMYSTQLGIAAWGDRTWIASRASKELALVDAAGKVIGHGSTTLLADFNYDNIKLSWDGSGLIMAFHNQIIWLSVTPQ